MSVERNIQERLIFFEGLRKEAEGIQERIEEIQTIKNELDRTIECLEFFDKVESVEALLNLGGGVFAYADVKENKKVLVDVGAGVIIEKEVKDAIETLRNKKDEMEKTEQKLRDLLNQIASQMMKIQKELEELMKKAREQELQRKKD
uniref:Prefoldin subunit alpha n=1 Tax=Geoglobus ahangari TaxID=113653 RepID=A0A7C3UGU5_9EURY